MDSTSEDKMKTSLLSSFLAGAISSAIAKTVVAPLEWAKINFQVSDMRMTTRSMVSLLLKRAREDGPTALWRGNTAALVRVVPSSGIAFAANDALKHLLKDDRRPEEDSKPARSFLAGAMAGTLAHSATYPLDVARTAMAVSRHKIHRSLSQAILGIFKNKGVRGLYRGYAASLFGMAPYSGISFGMYGLLNDLYAGRKGMELNTIEQGACGAASGATAMILAYPMEVVQRRQQSTAFTSGKKENLMETMKTIRKSKGSWRGFYKGLGVNCLIGPIQIGLAFAGYELAKRFLDGALS